MRRTLFLRLWQSRQLNQLVSPRLCRIGFNAAAPLQVRHQGSFGRYPNNKSLSAKQPGKSPEDPTENKPAFEELALLTPAIIPEDPMGVVRPRDSAAALLDHSALVVERQIEMLNVFLVFALTAVIEYRVSNNVIVMLSWTPREIMSGTSYSKQSLRLGISQRRQGVLEPR